MVKVHHLNCVHIESPLGTAIGHCLLLEEDENLVLVDSGIGLDETENPESRLGKELIEATGFKFDPNNTAIKQVEKLGFNSAVVKNCVCSHMDPDHIGGLADFEDMKINVSKEEFTSFQNGDPRYLPVQLEHQPEIQLYEINDSEWFGLPARKLDLPLSIPLYLVPLFGHTLGHCGVVFQLNGKWTFYVGDAYYLRAELLDRNLPVDQLATLRAMDNELRRMSLRKVREVIANHPNEIEYFCYHEPMEFQLYGEESVESSVKIEQ